MQELQDALAVLAVELAQLPVNLGRQLNAVGHDVLLRLSAGWCALRRGGCVRERVRPDTGPPYPPGVQGWLRVRSRFWCARCAGLASPGVSRWTAEVEWLA